jgi:alcohol dehydrogenase class IV
MDALTQAIEAYTSRNATWLSDSLALQAARLIANHLKAVYQDPTSADSEPLLIGSYLAGVAFSFARLGVVHGMAHPLGSLYHLPHGVVCAACLPHAIQLNRDAYGIKYDNLSTALGGDLLNTVLSLKLRLNLQSPFLGQPLREADQIIKETLVSGSTKANPKLINRADVEWMLARLFAPPGHPG